MKYRNMLNRPVAGALLFPIALALGGCALMGGGSKPPTFYQFGRSDLQAESAATAPIGPAPVVLYGGSSFERQSQSDRILTSTGGQAAYVAEARWVAPAAELFDAAAVRRLEAASPHVRVTRMGDRPLPDYLLTVDVQRFEANYANGPEAAPEVIVESRARLMRAKDRTIVGDWPIAQREPAGENRVTAIVAAFDRATAKVTEQIAVNTATAVGGR